MKVTDTYMVNSSVKRLISSKFEIDVLTMCCNVNKSDNITINVSEKEDEDSDIVYEGYVYSTDDKWSYISSGGLLCKINKKLPLHSSILVNLHIQSKKRKNM